MVRISADLYQPISSRVRTCLFHADLHLSAGPCALSSPDWSGVPRLIADSVKDPLRRWFEAAQRLLLQTVRDGFNKRRLAQPSRWVRSAKRHPFLSQSTNIKSEKVRDFLFQIF